MGVVWGCMDCRGFYGAVRGLYGDLWVVVDCIGL